MQRAQARESLTRLVEYAPVPRTSADQRRRVAVTRDLSAAGLCMAASSAEPVGTLLHVSVSRVDGRPAVDALARVVWCRETSESRWWIGLSLIGEARPARAGMRFVRRTGPMRRIALA